MKKLAKAVILGFPNVGKSTLFNRLLGRKKTLVHSLPGMTRDVVSALCTLHGKSFILSDTGGFFSSEKEVLSSLIKEKAWKASQGADILLFVLDGRRGLLPGEEELFLSLRKLNKPVLVVINKIDTETQENTIGDFYRLGERNVYPVSAEHKRNLSQLEDALASLAPSPSPGAADFRPLKIAVIGRINVGKSSLINRLCGEERLIVSKMPGTTRDSTDTWVVRNGKVFCLVDTAGIRRLSRTRDEREKAGIIVVKKNIARADVLCLVLDAQEFPTRQDTMIARLAQKSGKPMLIALNKWDLLKEENDQSDKFRTRVFQRLEFVSYAPLLSVSALSGKRAVKILDLAEEVVSNGSKRVETSRLNEFLAWVGQKYPPPARSRHKIKLKYITQKGVLPPSFILFLKPRVPLPPAYEKFFLQLLREKFAFWGTPLRLFLRES